ncbi:riboflavin kinase [Patescibacteria group bacterium]|nr:riboflavin kinase [Patescibacteria group bacterium]
MQFIRGKVIKGEQIGKQLGFPTANLSRRVLIGKRLGHGVYTALVRFNHNKKLALVIIGVPGIKKQPQGKVEVYILNFRGNLYGKFLLIEVYKKLRPIKKYTDAKSLDIQIRKDIQQARNFFK